MENQEILQAAERQQADEVENAVRWLHGENEDAVRTLFDKINGSPPAKAFSQAEFRVVLNLALIGMFAVVIEAENKRTGG